MKPSFSNPKIKIIKEIAFEFLNLILGNVWNKIGLSVLFIILSAICIFSPIVNQNGESLPKPIVFEITGFILLIISIGLIVKRYNEIKKETYED